MKVTVQRGLVGKPEVNAGLDGNGQPIFVIHYEGTRVTLVFETVDEANTIGTAIISAGGVSAFLAAEREKQLVDGNGVNVRPILG